MSGYHILKDLNCPYFVTCTIVKWLPILTIKPVLKVIQDALAYIRINKDCLLHAYVIMPTHLHVILKAKQGDDISERIRDFKRYTSRTIGSLLSSEKNWETPIDVVYRYTQILTNAKGRNSFWKRGFHPEALYSRNFTLQKINYIHHNPKRSGLVDNAIDWMYSSARFYYSGEEVYPPVDPIEI